MGSLFLHRDCHGMGIGRAVMEAVERDPARSGFDRIGLGVYAMDTQGLDFWVGWGYDRLEKVRISRHGRAILRLSKALSAESTYR